MTDKNDVALRPELIGNSIFLIRGQRVILDSDLAYLYGIATKRLNEQVKRNRSRFPSDFMFQLSNMELASLNRSQIATGSQRHRNPRSMPYAFTEHGAIMAASVLNSPRAIETSILVVRTFVRLREILASNKELASRLDELERKLATHDQAITGILNAIRELMASPPSNKRPIGFVELEETK